MNKPTGSLMMIVFSVCFHPVSRLMRVEGERKKPSPQDKKDLGWPSHARVVNGSQTIHRRSKPRHKYLDRLAGVSPKIWQRLLSFMVELR